MTDIATKHYTREADGQTYYFHNGVLMGEPTNISGSCDFDLEQAIPVDEYTDKLTASEVVEIITGLHIHRGTETQDDTIDHLGALRTVCSNLLAHNLITVKQSDKVREGLDIISLNLPRLK